MFWEGATKETREYQQLMEGYTAGRPERTFSSGVAQQNGGGLFCIVWNSFASRLRAAGEAIVRIEERE